MVFMLLWDTSRNTAFFILKEHSRFCEIGLLVKLAAKWKSSTLVLHDVKLNVKR